MAEYLDKLNEEQIAPVMHTDGAVLVIAGAGSGKTRVLTSRIAHIVKDLSVDPYNILAITFTNKAADEMKERLESLIGDVSDMWVCTIHSMCVRILRMAADKIGYDRNFSIYSETDRDKVLKRIITGLALDNDKYLKRVKIILSALKNKDKTTEDFKAENPRLPELGNYVRILDAYENEMKRSNAFDFDDLLIKTYHLLAENKDVLDRFSSRFKYIHVDEFQDTNVVQYNIVKLLSVKHGNIFAVGDDDQSIYGWRGADIHNILGFKNDFKDATIYKLQRNYRSTKRILQLANAVIKYNRNRNDKTLWTDNDEGVKPEVYFAEEESSEAQYAAVQIKTLIKRGYSYSDFAILMRINALSRSYEQEFLKYGIPYKVYGGFKFFERKEIKDLTAYLRILCNPLDNEAILRVINVPKRGIGDKTIQAINDYATTNGFSVFDGIYDYENLPLSASAKQKLKGFKDIVSSLVVYKETAKLKDLVKEVIRATDFMSCFDDDSVESDDKKRNVDEFLSSVEEFERQNPNASLSEYLNSITLSSDTDEINEGDFVTLATIHSVKGLEYRCVFICGLDESIFPIERADSEGDDAEEERRLMYVAITRAKERLYLTRAKSRFLYGSRRRTVQSQYLDDLSSVLGLSQNRRQYFRETYRTDYYQGGRGENENEYGYSPDIDTQSNVNYSKNYGFSGNFATYYINASKKNERPADKDISKFRVGTKVLHKKFGEGTIISVKGNGEDVIGDIAFNGIGIKSLVLRLAPIEVI